MSTVKLSLSEWVVYLNMLGKRFKPAALRGLRKAAMQGVQTLRQNTSTALLVNTGAYKRGWKYIPLSNGALIYNAQPYAGVLERGRRRGGLMPPTLPLTRWAQRKLGLSKKNAKRAGFAIALAIKKRGTKGRRIMTDARPGLYAMAHQSVLTELNKALMGRP